MIRGRLLALARGWDRGGGPRAVLACAPGEQHDLGLIVFGLALRHQGWSVTYLGADTPVETLAAAAEQLQPDAVVVVALEPGKLEPIRAPLEELARGSRLLLAGAGAGESYAAELGAELLRGDPVDAAAQLAPASGRPGVSERSFFRSWEWRAGALVRRARVGCWRASLLCPRQRGSTHRGHP